MTRTDVFVERWWPIPIAVSGALFVVISPGPHPFTPSGIVERVLFAQSALALFWLAFRPSFAARIATIVLIGAAMLTRSGAYLFGAYGLMFGPHFHRFTFEERLAGALTWLTGYIAIALLAIVTSRRDHHHGR